LAEATPFTQKCARKTGTKKEHALWIFACKIKGCSYFCAWVDLVMRINTKQSKNGDCAKLMYLMACIFKREIIRTREVRWMPSKFDLSQVNSMLRVTCVHVYFQCVPRKTGTCFLVLVYYTFQWWLRFLPKNLECGPKSFAPRDPFKLSISSNST